MNITDYYLACNNVCKNYNIPNDISRYIFDFEIENIKKKLLKKKKIKIQSFYSSRFS